MGRITIKKEKNSHAKLGYQYVISEDGQRRFTKRTKVEATKGANRLRK
jgi:hypothetical protein